MLSLTPSSGTTGGLVGYGIAVLMVTIAGVVTWAMRPSPSAPPMAKYHRAGFLSEPFTREMLVDCIREYLRVVPAERRWRGEKSV